MIISSLSATFISGLCATAVTRTMNFIFWILMKIVIIMFSIMMTIITILIRNSLLAKCFSVRYISIILSHHIHSPSLLNWRRVRDSNPEGFYTRLFSRQVDYQLSQPGIYWQGFRPWSWWTDSDPRPSAYKALALPTELHQHIYNKAQFLNYNWTDCFKKYCCVSLLN